MSIPALGGGAHQALQRALMDAAERALTDEAGSLDGEDPATASQTAAGAASAGTRAAVRRRAAASRAASTTPLDEAIVVELGEQARAEPLEVAGGWITTAKRGSLETRGMPAPPPETTQADAAHGDDAAPAVAERQRRLQQDQDDSEGPDEAIGLDRLIVVLKKTGIDFRDAYQVLREIRAGEPLPARAELRARWAAADPAAWEERARARAASSAAEPAGSGPSGSAPVESAPSERRSAARRAADADLRRTPVDDLIRDRGWHRAHERSDGTTIQLGGPTLQTVVRQSQANQVYLAALSTAEFQRLVTVAGRNAPEWFWDVRGHRGLRGLAERPAVARLNTTRIAGTRLGAWILAVLGIALLWYLGLRTGTWW